MQYLSELRAPQIERNFEHLMEETLLIAIAAVLSCAESGNAIAKYSGDKQECVENIFDDSFRHPVARYLQLGLCRTWPGSKCPPAVFSIGQPAMVGNINIRRRDA
jgi:hypothetical protein